MCHVTATKLKFSIIDPFVVISLQTVYERSYLSRFWEKLHWQQK